MPLEDRTEAATARRREEVREEGRVAKSGDATTAVQLLICLLVARSLGPSLLEGMKDMLRYSLTHIDVNVLTMERLPSLASGYLTRIAAMCLPFAAVAASVGMAANVLQVGLKVTPKTLHPNFGRLDPIKGTMNLLSGRAMVELAKSIAKVVVVGLCIYTFLRDEMPGLLRLSGMQPSEMVQFMADLCWRLLIRGCLAFVLIGAVDYIYQRFSFEKSIRMTKQEVKEEFKRTEGDPQIKGRIKQRQREMSRRRMMQDVSKADVVITNPTHFAVAIRYDTATMSAPTVVAKGQRMMAAKIRAIAEANNVPIVQNPPVARLLYKTVEVGRQIPEELYQAVAEILAFIYEMNGKTAAVNR